MPEGTIVFQRVPVMIFEGPVAVCQLLESAVLNTLNFASLITTKSARIRLLAKDKTLLEFGLRRAQGPDGALSASRYSYLGGFDATSNVLAGKLFNIPISGTHAHSFVSSFTSLLEVTNTLIKSPDKKKYDLKKLALKYRKELGYENSNEGELASFLSYAISFPKSFLALVDTYDTINSGIPNFLCIALSLLESGYKPVGIRLDSGDLAYLSKKAREIFNKVSKKYSIDLSYLKITASNDIDEDIIESLNLQKHEIDIFGIGTKLATCYQQPALGYVYKLVMLNNIPRIKISQNINKITIPGKKKVFRIWTNQSCPFADLIMSEHEKTPKINEKILLRHPFFENKRILIKPSKIIPLYKTVFDKGKMLNPEKTEKIRSYIKEQIGSMREDHLRRDNPARYKVSVSQDLYEFMQELLAKESPVEEIN